MASAPPTCSELGAVRHERHIIEGDGLSGCGRPIDDVAALVAIVALEEPHALGDRTYIPDVTTSCTGS